MNPAALFFGLLAVPLVTLAQIVPAPALALTPDRERASFQFADPALTAELVAAEPDVVSPVAITWDADGRMYVAEMRDYPNAGDGGTIRLLQGHRSGAGAYHSAKVFADKLPFPNSVLPWNGGVLVTATPDLWFLKDNDGDGVADERRVLFTGFGTGNQQLRANGLYWGLDGWVYGANGRSDGLITRPGSTNQWSLRGRDFRFRPDTGSFETIAGRSQFGLSRDDWGNRFLSWNTIPVRHEVFPDRLLGLSERFAGFDVVADTLPAGDTGQVFPLTPAPLVFNNESGSHFNALAGLHIYRGHALGAAYRGNAFMGETLRNLVHRRVLVPAGSTFRAERGEQGREFLASTDPWFHPVNFATGPDGALYIVDFYRQFVEHPDWVPREMRDKVGWRAGSEHGRIWRVQRPGGEPLPTVSAVNLASASSADLVQELASPNAWQRDTAQRLLQERRDVAIRPLLEKLARTANLPESRVLALRVAQNLQILEESPVRAALRDPDARVREQALALAARRFVYAPGNLTWPVFSRRLVSAVERMAGDSDSRVRLQAALALGLAPQTAKTEKLLSGLGAGSSDHWLKQAVVEYTKDTNASWYREFVASLKPSTRPAPKPVQADPDRARVVERYRPALQLVGDRSRGAATFAKLCTACHYLQGHGQRVGPDLSGIASRPLEALLADVLDPSRQVAPDYATYEVITTTGESVSGLLASETATRVTLRHAGAPDETIARSAIKEMRASGKSLMPDGLENGLGPQDVADLLAFLQKPDGELLPK